MEITPELYQPKPERIPVLMWPTKPTFPDEASYQTACADIVACVINNGGEVMLSSGGGYKIRNSYLDDPGRQHNDWKPLMAGDRIAFQAGGKVRVYSAYEFTRDWERSPERPKPVENAECDGIKRYEGRKVEHQCCIHCAPDSHAPHTFDGCPRPEPELANLVAPLVNAEVPRGTEPPQVGLCVLCYTSLNPPVDSIARYVVGGIGVCREHVDQAIEES